MEIFFFLWSPATRYWTGPLLDMETSPLNTFHDFYWKFIKRKYHVNAKKNIFKKNVNEKNIQPAVTEEESKT